MKKNLVLSKNLKKFRKDYGYSMLYLSQKLGLSSHGVYANWEYGRNEPNIKMLISIANLYKVSIDELVGYDKIINNNVNNEEYNKELLSVISFLNADDLDLIMKIARRIKGYRLSIK